MYDRVTALSPLCYLHHRLPVIANHYRDNAITYKAQRDKNARELKLTTRNDYMQMLIRWLCRRKYTKELADAKAENDACGYVAAGRRRLLIKQSVSHA